MKVMHLRTSHQVQLTQAVHPFKTTQGTATIESTALGDDDQTPQARPTQAVWVNATADTDVAVDPDLEWTAVHYTPDCTENDPTLTDWLTRRAASTTSPSTATPHRRPWSPRDEPPVRTRMPPSTPSGTTRPPYTQRQ